MKLPLVKTYLQWFTVKQNWEHVRITMQRMRMNKSVSWIQLKYPPSTSISVMYVSQMYTVIEDIYGGKWILDYDQVMMISDTISSRVFSLLYCEILHQNNKNKVPSIILQNIYKRWDSIFTTRGNNTYLLIKMWEPIIQGLLLKHHDPLQISGDYIKQVIADASPDIKDDLVEMITFLESCNLNPFQLSDIHGIYRHWGHPTVDEEGGCRKVKNIAQNRPVPDFIMMKKAKAVFIRQFCISFIGEHARWPRINFSKLPSSSSLRKVIERNITTINFYSPKFSLKQWGLLELKKEFEFDFHLDYIDVCDDKAISPYLHQLPTIYAPEILGYNPGRPTSSRRVLLELLRKKEIDIKAICQKIMCRDIPESWKIVLLHSKEREMKLEPRLFAMFVLEMRLYYCVTESNLSRTIFKYFPQQTMTLSEIELTKRLYSMAENDYNEHYLPLYMSIDFKSWNIHWQFLSTYDIFATIDSLFGTRGLYTYSHLFFSESLIAISSRFNPPNYLKDIKTKRWEQFFVEEDLSWKHHRGGFEGIRQKGWTLVTIIMLLIVELKTGIKSLIIGQGDNQFLKLLLPILSGNYHATRQVYILNNQKTITENLKFYCSVLSKVAEAFGLVIKQEESWFSSQIINYGKDILFDGAYTSQGLKGISRTLSDTNDLIPTISTKLSSIQTTGLSTAKKGMDIWTPMFICHVETLMMLQREVLVPLIYGVSYTKQQKEWIATDRAINFILHGDTNCFSISVLNIYNYLYRGHPDPLTSYLTFLTDNASHCRYCTENLIWLSSTSFKLGRGDPELLINDPLSLNIEGPPLVSHIFKNQVLKKVKTLVVNRDLKEIFRINCEKEDDEVYKYLISTQPLYPRVLHELMGQTITGTRLCILAKFSSARTLQLLLTRPELSSFYGRVISSEQAIVSYWMTTSYRVMDVGIHLVLKKLSCPTNLASFLRNYTWKNTTKGQSINGVTIPFPLHQFHMNCSENGTSHETCTGEAEYICYVSNPPISHDMCFTRGPYQAFYGHRTRERQSGRIFQIPDTTRPLQAAERLIQLYQWCLSTDEYMTRFIQNLIQTRTDIPMDVLQLTTGTIMSGSQVHRLNDHFTKRGVLLNIRPNSSTHVYFSTDEMGKYSRGSDNMNMHFQGALMMGLTYVHNIMMFQEESHKPITLHQHYKCIQCEEYIPDIKISSPQTPPTIRNYSKNPLIYSTIENLPPSISPSTLVFKMVRGSNANYALASLIFSRILSNINRSAWGTTQSNKAYSSKISVRSVIDIGIHKVLKHLSLLLFLYFHNNVLKVLHVLCTHQKEIWQDISQACLMPENLEILHEISGFSYQAQIYEAPIGMSRLLTRALSNQIHTLHNTNIIMDRNIIFFIVPGCGISRIFRMWSNMIYLISKGTVDVRAVCQNMDFDINVGLNIPSKSSVDTLDNFVQNNRGNVYREYCWKKYPLQLSKTPAEAVLKLWCMPRVDRPPRERVALRATRASYYFNTTFPVYLELPDIERDINASMICEDTHVPPIDKLRSDHAFHLCKNLSSSYLKVMQIVLSFQISCPNPIVCMCDGEGSIAKFLHMYYNVPIYFNTKIDPTSLVPQRAINYIPGEFIDIPQGVKLSNLSALYGGDILDDNYFDMFCSKIPSKISLVTADPEGPDNFPNGLQSALLIRVLQVCFKTAASWLIYKCFLTSSTHVSNMVSIINTLYRSIFMTVPIYSSNESYECYIVCHQFDPVIKYSDIGKVQTMIGLFSLSSISTIRASRIQEQPFQIEYSLWKDLIKKGKQLKFNHKITHDIERLLDFAYFVPEDISLNTLDDCIHKILDDVTNLLQTEWKSISKRNVGQSLSQDEKILSSSGVVYHKLLNQFSIWRSNLIILQKMLNITSIGKLQKLFKSFCSTDASLLDKQGHILYKYATTYHDIKGDYIRSLWTIWGYKHLSCELENT
uniref:RNA-directed RNA polymerase L n=1 Tax=Lampyris noctiluca rhabdo-like virus 1 TaxID=2552994 RepID=A0A482JV29_9RHAB|nr:putative polyprotein [Lampyris noctiluca rhabdo-like virus 1]